MMLARLCLTPMSLRSGILLLVGVLLCPVLSRAQVPTTITSSGLGTSVNQAGTTHNITGGARNGSNLFHSFGLFSVGTGDTANFNNETGLATSNILGRVTGGEASSIFGTIQTSNFGAANLFLINPAGWIFGPTASLNVGGAFHVSTADYIRFSDGARFHADLSQNTVLTSAPPAAFGFLGPPASISVDSSFLQVPEGQTLSMVGGDVQITGGFLTAPSGRIQIASVASAGEVTIPDLDVSSFSSLGQINISANIDGVPSTLDASDVSGIGGGTVVIRGGNLFVDNSIILSNTFGDIDGAPVGIDLWVTEEMALTAGSFVGTSTSGAGRGGDLQLTADQLQIDGSSVFTQTADGGGTGGNLSMTAGTLSLTGGGTITSLNLSLGSGLGGLGGNIDINADSVTISGPSRVGTETQSSGDGGQLTLSALSLTMNAGGNINSSTISSGRGGNINVTASESATISGVGDDLQQSGIFSSSFGEGPAGDLTLNFGALSLTDGASIQSGTIAGNQGGNVTLNATDSILISGCSIVGCSGISSQAFIGGVGQVSIITPGNLTINNGFISTSTTEAGNAGPVNIGSPGQPVGLLTLVNGGQITSNSDILASGAGGNVTITANSVSISGTSPDGVPSSPFSADPRSGVFSTASGTGPGGNINIQAQQSLDLGNDGTISAKSSGTEPTALAGNINIMAGELLRMQNSVITTESLVADGGNIAITTTGSLLHMTNSQITTSVQSGIGEGGNITIGSQVQPFEFIILNNGGIHANAFGGPGGNINILSDQLLSSLPIATAVTASSALSTPGTIDIQATIPDVSGGVSQLPEAPLQATELLRASCAARLAEGKSSSLVLAGRDGVPLEPGSLLPSPLYLGADSAITKGSHPLPEKSFASSQSQFSLFGSSTDRVQLGMGWNQFQLAKAALGLDCSQ